MICKGLSSPIGGAFTDGVVLDLTVTSLGFSFFWIILQFPEKFGSFGPPGRFIPPSKSSDSKLPGLDSVENK